MTPCGMLEDVRAIQWISWANGDVLLQVGKRGVTKIVAYGEPRHLAMVPWLAVYKDDMLWQRIDSAGKEIGYA